MSIIKENLEIILYNLKKLKISYKNKDIYTNSLKNEIYNHILPNSANKIYYFFQEIKELKSGDKIYKSIINYEDDIRDLIHDSLLILKEANLNLKHLEEICTLIEKMIIKINN